MGWWDKILEGIGYGGGTSGRPGAAGEDPPNYGTPTGGESPDKPHVKVTGPGGAVIPGDPQSQGRFGFGSIPGPGAAIDWLGQRPGGPTSNVPAPTASNFSLPGADERQLELNALADQYGRREAPQAMDSSFRADQATLIDRLRSQMGGADSLAQMQLRNATDSNIAQQRSLAAGAGPQNAAMMARLAAQNIGRMNQGYGSQAAMLGIQERNAAANALGQVAQGARGQDLQLGQFNVGAKLNQQQLNDQAAQAARAQELQNAELQQRGGIGYEQNNTSRYGIDKGVAVQPSNFERIVGAATALAPIAMASDERVKNDAGVASGSLTDRLTRALEPHVYSYQDQRMGAGPRLGVMAQDVERGGPVGRALVGEAGGVKTLDVPKSLGTALGLIGRLGERLDELEGRTARTKQTARPSMG
jgi:hypothetical protein